MVYTSEAEVEAELAVDIGESSTFPCTSTQCTRMIAKATVVINAFLRVASDVTDTEALATCKAVAIDLVAQQIIRIRQFREMNLVQGPIQTNIVLTPEHQDMLSPYRNQHVARTYDIYTGEEVTSTNR